MAVTLDGHDTGKICIVCKKPILTGQSYEEVMGEKLETRHIGCVEEKKDG